MNLSLILLVIGALTRGIVDHCYPELLGVGLHVHFNKLLVLLIIILLLRCTCASYRNSADLIECSSLNAQEGEGTFLRNKQQLNPDREKDPVWEKEGEDRHFLIVLI